MLKGDGPREAKLKGSRGSPSALPPHNIVIHTARLALALYRPKTRDDTPLTRDETRTGIDLNALFIAPPWITASSARRRSSFHRCAKAASVRYHDSDLHNNGMLTAEHLRIAYGFRPSAILVGTLAAWTSSLVPASAGSGLHGTTLSDNKLNSSQIGRAESLMRVSWRCSKSP